MNPYAAPNAPTLCRQVAEPYRQIDEAIYIEHGDAVKAGISYWTLKDAKRRKSASWRIIDDPADRRRNLICINTMRRRRKKYYNLIAARYGDPFVPGGESPAQGSPTPRRNHAETPPLAVDPAHVKLFADSGTGDAKARTLARVAAYYRLLAADKTTLKAYGFATKNEWRAALVAQMQSEGLPHAHANVRVLQRKIQAYGERGAAAFLGAPRRSSAPRLTIPVRRRLIDWYASPLKPTFAKVAAMYESERHAHGWPSISKRHIARYLSQPAIKALWAEARHGATAARAALGYQITRRRASFPDALWSFDGTRVPLAWAEAATGKARNNLYIQLVIDNHSDAILAYRLGATETTELVMGALKDALRNTMRRPRQLQYDAGAANMASIMQGFMDRMTRVHFPCRPYTPRAKRVENVIGRLQQQLLKLYPNFTGSNITSPSVDGKANPDFLAKQKKRRQLPALEEAAGQVAEAVKRWNEGARLNAYNAEHPGRRPLLPDELVSLFMARRKRPVTYRPDGVTVQVGKRRHTFIVPDADGVGDYDFRRFHLGKKFDIYADADDLSMVYLYMPGTDKLVAAAWRKEAFAEAVVDRKPGERARLQQLWKKDNDYLAQLKKELKTTAQRTAIGLPELGPAGANKEMWNAYEAEQERASIHADEYQKHLFNDEYQ